MTARCLFPLLLLALPISGCFDFDYPIDAAPQLALDLSLLGTWRCLSVGAGADQEPATLTISVARDRVYAMTFDLGEEKVPMRFEAHVSRVKGHAILNARDLAPDPSDKPWRYVRYWFARKDIS